ncbi:MAG TPA: hypothetical protein VNQ90_15480 [Chthoniobacteraceae bacterium]|nr:hypothetical protein [Chthoniobacteraceae bacterium]
MSITATQLKYARERIYQIAETKTRQFINALPPVPDFDNEIEKRIDSGTAKLRAKEAILSAYQRSGRRYIEIEKVFDFGDLKERCQAANNLHQSQREEIKRKVSRRANRIIDDLVTGKQTDLSIAIDAMLKLNSVDVSGEGGEE